jgi:excisionase family DNA binding protein
MGNARLVRVTWLQNHGLEVAYRGEPVRFVGPDGDLSVSEAAKALGTYPVLLRRMITHRRLEAKRVGGVLRIPMTEVLSLRRTWKATGRPTGRIERPARTGT